MLDKQGVAGSSPAVSTRKRKNPFDIDSAISNGFFSFPEKYLILRKNRSKEQVRRPDISYLQTSGDLYLGILGADHIPVPSLLLSGVQQPVGVAVQLLRRAADLDGERADTACQMSVLPGNLAHPLHEMS